MSKKIMLLALTAVSAVMFALPAVASAGEWEMVPGGKAFTVDNVGNTVLTTNNNETVTCTKVAGTGTYNTAPVSTTTGTVEMTFTGCTTIIFGFTVNCTTSGLATGTITTTTVGFTNIYLTDAKTTPGVKLTGAGADEHFATFTCGGVKIVVSGSVIGESESICNHETKEHKLKFESTAHGIQQWKQNTLTGPETDLTATVGGTAHTASQDGTGKLTFNQNEKVVCA